MTPPVVILSKEENKGFPEYLKEYIYKENLRRNSGRIICEKTGEDITTKRRGYHFDHIISKKDMSYMSRGSRVRREMNEINNCMLVSRKYNLGKSGKSDITAYCEKNGISLIEYHKRCCPDSVTSVPVNYGSKFSHYDAAPMDVEPKPVSKLRWWFYGVLSAIGALMGLVFMVVIAFSGI